MGTQYNEDKTACIRPPPQPTRRPIPTLAENEKTIATVISKTASSVLIFFVTITLLLFLALRIFTSDRIIQMNMEIALLCAHILLVLPSSLIDKEVRMKKKQLLSAKISQRTNLVILFFVIAHMLVGMLSEYEQNLPLYGTFSVLNGVTGALVFFLHCTNNQRRSVPPSIA
ncbi:hypothetical protein Avbf_05037 [Armadillidium vulgare]|nr:hypothetical protein Avbf_05037 [Armadillidium vulgare]